jgi:SAM-dependent methyltransferase
MTEKRREGNPNWKDWYPSAMPDFSTFEIGKSPYGEPNPETLDVFRKLPRNSDILDVGGGDGRNALPLAQMGHNVTVLDIDMPHLEQLHTNAKAVLSSTSGKIDSVLADFTEDLPLQRQFDGVLTAGFAHLMPPDQLDPIFARVAKTLKPGGIFVCEFSTNKVRRDIGKLVAGKEEYFYTYEEGLHTLQVLYEKYDVKLMTLQTKSKETPFCIRLDLIIAHGIKQVLSHDL